MPIYRVEQYEFHSQTHGIEAKNEARAVQRPLAGQAEPRNGGSQYIDVPVDLGLPVDLNPELAKELGVDTDGIIPSIRGITAAT